MARPIILSNGSMHVGLNKWGLVHDFYYPHVGLENHSAGRSLRHKVGVWVDGSVAWLDDGSWDIAFSYPKHALIGQTIAKNSNLNIEILFSDFVDSENDIFGRKISVKNLSDHSRDIRVFMHQAFNIGDGASNTDTAQYLPDTEAILHYRGNRVFVIGGTYESGQEFDQFSIGLFGIEGREGTWRDAEDGELACGTVEHGKVDSTIRFKMDIEAGESKSINYWIAAGKSLRSALKNDKICREKGLDYLVSNTEKWWNNWLSSAEKIIQKVDPAYQDRMRQSLMFIKSHTDKDGAVIASTDTTMLNYSRDAYGYCWPRDGAFVLWPLIRMGYLEEALNYFRFIKRGLHPAGYLMHKYRADGAIGSSWHSYVHGNEVAPPIQTDETALSLFVLVQAWRQDPETVNMAEFYEDLLVPMADFLAGWIHPQTNLPKSSYDLWEEVYETTTYTTAVTYASLLAAAEVADVIEDADRAVRWRNTADDIYQSAQKYLFNPERGHFYKGVSLDSSGISGKDETYDLSSFFGAFMFGLFPVGSKKLNSSYQAMQRIFEFNEVPEQGLPRYQGDNYHRLPETKEGNSWYNTTLWLAQYYIEIGKTGEAKQIIDWVTNSADATGILPEQRHPVSGEPLSVAPLVWSHAEYIATLLDTITEQNHEA